jgi:hypothetical protein
VSAYSFRTGPLPFLPSSPADTSAVRYVLPSCHGVSFPIGQTWGCGGEWRPPSFQVTCHPALTIVLSKHCWCLRPRAGRAQGPVCEVCRAGILGWAGDCLSLGQGLGEEAAFTLILCSASRGQCPDGRKPVRDWFPFCPVTASPFPLPNTLLTCWTCGGGPIDSGASEVVEGVTPTLLLFLLPNIHSLEVSQQGTKASSSFIQVLWAWRLSLAAL